MNAIQASLRSMCSGVLTQTAYLETSTARQRIDMLRESLNPVLPAGKLYHAPQLRLELRIREFCAGLHLRIDRFLAKPAIRTHPKRLERSTQPGRYLRTPVFQQLARIALARLISEQICMFGQGRNQGGLGWIACSR